VLFVLGLLGFLMRRYGLPVVPAIVGVILGPRAEEQMRRALQISDGELNGLYNTWFAKTLYIVVALIVLWPLVNRFVIRPLRRQAEIPVLSEAAHVLDDAHHHKLLPQEGQSSQPAAVGTADDAGGLPGRHPPGQQP
jgi:putative tricarboxylic transport membrane protein